MYDEIGWFAIPEEVDTRSEAQRQTDDFLRYAAESVRVTVQNGELRLTKDTFEDQALIGFM